MPIHSRLPRTTPDPHPCRPGRVLGRGLLLVIGACLAGAAVAAEPGRSVPEVDWVPYASLPPEMQNRRARSCGGGYVDPLAAVGRSTDPAGQPVHGDGEFFEMEGNRARWHGGVSLRQGYRQLRADRAEYDLSSSMATLEGNVEFREPGIHLRGDSSEIDLISGAARLDNAAMVEHERHIHGSASQVRRRPDRMLELDQAEFTYCPPTDQAWRLRSRELQLDLERGIGKARGVRLEVADAPILYLPLLHFPIDERRMSGFLWPQLGRASNGGLDIATPYYVNLAPNYDLTVTPRAIADRGLMGQARARYLGPLLGAWELDSAYLQRDSEYRRDVPGRSGTRWLASVHQQGLVARRWRTHLEYTRVSDRDYFNEIGSSEMNLYQSTHLVQRGLLDYLGDDWQARLRVEQFQTLARDIALDPYKKLPSIGLQRVTAERDGRLNFLYLGEYSDFDHDSRITGQRLYHELGLSYPRSWLSGFFRATAKYRRLDLRLDREVSVDGRSDDSPHVAAPLLSLDGGLFFERELERGGGRLIQTLEPRLYYLWADYERQDGLPDFDTSQLTFSYSQLFRENRFAGYGRLNDANQLALGLATRILDPESGEQKLHASIGQLHYFEDQRVALQGGQGRSTASQSAVAAELAFQLWKTVQFRSSWLWDHKASQLDEAHQRLSWLRGRNHILHLGYNWRRYRGTDPRFGDINQFDVSAIVPLGENWLLFFQSLYDLEESDTVNDLVGIEYDSCCWRMRLLFQRNLNQTLGAGQPGGPARVGRVETRNAILLEFHLKGLGGVGTRVNGILEEVFRGYEASDE